MEKNRPEAWISLCISFWSLCIKEAEERRRKREAGNQEPVINFDTGQKSQDHEEANAVEEMDASEKLFEEPVVSELPELDQLPD